MSNLIDSAKSPKISIVGKNSEKLRAALGIAPARLEDCDGAIFIVSAQDGIVSADIDLWRQARELYVPSLIVITELGSSDIDFEDMSAIASKILDPVVTPFLVLHDESGLPAALIDLQTLQITDYSANPVLTSPASQEHQELVQQFREEYLEQLEDAGEESFQAGLLFPALPWIENSPIGISEIKRYLDQIPVLG